MRFLREVEPAMRFANNRESQYCDYMKISLFVLWPSKELKSLFTVPFFFLHHLCVSLLFFFDDNDDDLI